MTHPLGAPPSRVIFLHRDIALDEGTYRPSYDVFFRKADETPTRLFHQLGLIVEKNYYDEHRINGPGLSLELLLVSARFK